MSNVIYVGDSGDVIKRIRRTHCSGNVEGSAFRKHVATELGYDIGRTKRASGTTKVRLDLLDPKSGENEITRYMRSGAWRFVFCDSANEARDFQWYVIDNLRPALNRDSRSWDCNCDQRYSQLLHVLLDCHSVEYANLAGQTSGPGVYAFYHDHLPRS